MFIYIIVAICLIVDFMNPKILWQMDAWKYDGDKPEPSGTYMIVNRVAAGIGFVVLMILMLR